MEPWGTVRRCGAGVFVVVVVVSSSFVSGGGGEEVLLFSCASLLFLLTPEERGAGMACDLATTRPRRSVSDAAAVAILGCC